MRISTESILSHLSNTNGFELITLDDRNINIYKLTPKGHIIKNHLLLFITEESHEIEEGLSMISRLLDKDKSTNSVIWVKKVEGDFTIEDENPLFLFSDLYKTFIHFIYCDGQSVKYSTDFYYVGSKQVKKTIVEIVQSLNSGNN